MTLPGESQPRETSALCYLDGSRDPSSNRAPQTPGSLSRPRRDFRNRSSADLATRLIRPTSHWSWGTVPRFSCYGLLLAVRRSLVRRISAPGAVQLGFPQQEWEQRLCFRLALLRQRSPSPLAQVASEEEVSLRLLDRYLQLHAHSCRSRSLVLALLRLRFRAQEPSCLLASRFPAAGLRAVLRRLAQAGHRSRRAESSQPEFPRSRSMRPSRSAPKPHESRSASLGSSKHAQASLVVST